MIDFSKHKKKRTADDDERGYRFELAARDGEKRILGEKLKRAVNRRKGYRNVSSQGRVA